MNFFTNYNLSQHRFDINSNRLGKKIKDTGAIVPKLEIVKSLQIKRMLTVFR